MENYLHIYTLVHCTSTIIERLSLCRKAIKKSNLHQIMNYSYILKKKEKKSLVIFYFTA